MKQEPAGILYTLGTKRKKIRAYVKDGKLYMDSRLVHPLILLTSGCLLIAVEKYLFMPAENMMREVPSLASAIRSFAKRVGVTLNEEKENSHR